MELRGSQSETEWIFPSLYFTRVPLEQGTPRVGPVHLAVGVPPALNRQKTCDVTRQGRTTMSRVKAIYMTW